MDACVRSCNSCTPHFNNLFCDHGIKVIAVLQRLWHRLAVLHEELLELLGALSLDVDEEAQR